ncbi:ABC transporter permease [Roseomonas sp. WA12]
MTGPTPDLSPRGSPIVDAATATAALEPIPADATPEAAGAPPPREAGAVPHRQSRRDWLLTDAPASRSQAAWGRRYQAWLLFRRNPLAVAGLAVLLVMLLLILLAPVLATHDPGIQELGNRLARPSAAHWLGTDELGRDVWSRLLYGGRITLGMVVAVVLLVAPIGLLVGCVAGYAGGLWDRLLMRVTDVFLAFPRLILALAFVAAMRPGVESAVIAIALTAWPPYARLARAETLTIRRTDYVAAARMTGASPSRVVLRHVLPMCMPSLVVRVTLDMSSIILTAAGLGFLGLGAQPPLPEWGTMIATARRFILEQWWVAVMPGIAIFSASLAFNLLGDGLRDVLDPKQR